MFQEIRVLYKQMYAEFKQILDFIMHDFKGSNNSCSKQVCLMFPKAQWLFYLCVLLFFSFLEGVLNFH